MMRKLETEGQKAADAEQESGRTKVSAGSGTEQFSAALLHNSSGLSNVPAVRSPALKGRSRGADANHPAGERIRA